MYGPVDVESHSHILNSDPSERTESSVVPEVPSPIKDTALEKSQSFATDTPRSVILPNSSSVPAAEGYQFVGKNGPLSSDESLEVFEFFYQP